MVPTGVGFKEGSKTRASILNAANTNVEAKTFLLDTEVLPGCIEDTSFLPPELEKECSAYQWMVVSQKGDYSY